MNTRNTKLLQKIMGGVSIGKQISIGNKNYTLEHVYVPLIRTKCIFVRIKAISVLAFYPYFRLA